MTARYSLLLMMLVGLLLWLGMPSSTQASDRFWVGLNFSGVRPSVERVWIPGAYVMRIENVLVAPAHYENRWVPPIVETRYRSHHDPVTIVLREGYHERVLVPARYELREVRQWVPGYWTEVPVASCRPPFWGSFAWALGDRHDDRRDDRRDGPHDRRDEHGGHAGLNVRF